MNRTPFSRRRFMATLAATGAASRLSPFVPSSVRAQTIPKRLLTIFSPMGYLENSFWPKGTETNFTLGETMTALEPYKKHLIYLDGLLLYGAQYFYPDDDNEHASGQSMVFTGAKKKVYAEGPSIDQAVADHIYATTKTKYKSLSLGVNTRAPSPHASCFFSAAQTPVVAQIDAKAAFDSMFSNFKAPMLDTSAADRLRRQKQSVLDLVKGDIDRICNAASTEDKRKCDAHLTGIRALEQRLKAMPAQVTASAACKPPTQLTGSELDQKIRAMIDLITSAFACDFTRSASLGLGICDGGLDPFQGLNQHDTTHAVGDKPGDQTVIDNHKRFDRWFAGHWAYLLGKMAEIPEGNGSMLDNTLVLFGSDTTTGQTIDLGAHQHWRFPMWLAGGGNFAFPTGRYINLPRPTKADQVFGKQWTATQRVLTSVGRAFGMNINSFGNMDPATGPLTALKALG